MPRIALTALTIGWAAAGIAAAEATGLIGVEVSTPERDTGTRVSVFYPTDANGMATLVGDSAVFRGVPVIEHAPVAAGRHPLVLISHGGLRAAPGAANWLAAALAEQGYVAAVVAPPAVRGGAPSAAVLDEFWLRPAELSMTITALADEPLLRDRLDTTRVGAVGFFLGGQAVLGMAGARIDPGTLARSCDGPRRAPDCAWFEAGGVDLHAVDAARLVRTTLDSRLRAAVVVNPEYAGALTSSSLRSIGIPVMIVSLGPPSATLPDRDPRDLSATIPGAAYAAIEDARAVSAFPECKPPGRAILEADGEAALCDDGGGRSRAAIHARLSTLVADALREPLGAP